ncbi:hypothetical protein CXG81DRAFT_14083 [Caulochytrium protostelioides]|uniref:Mitochondrial carrier n=1 Tax=Caulochytrium protostelioides TaxID=1555241 RepID=A0A4P9X3X1_9FUNG|nr:hypothetical protein CXG81DRAFT_14083 [Caulochytrium protostelioides]|eukprot:RKO99746.1 hypothetical protein CXG81DRAFT_14083 [Caulochytrium protostelioides]
MASPSSSPSPAASSSSSSSSTTSSTPKLAPWQNAASGAFAGVVNRAIIAPIDVIKIRLQIETAALSLRQGRLCAAADAKYTSIAGTLRTVVREEGPAALWKGNVAAECLYLSYGAIQFLLYHELEARFHPQYRDVQTLAAGAVSGCVATAATYPFDLLRTQFAAQGRERVHRSLVGGVRAIVAREGVAGLYRGLAPSLVQIVPGMGLMFWVHGRAQLALRHVPRLHDHATVRDVVAGSLAGAVSKMAMMPLDVVRKRQQVQGPHRTRFVGRVPHYAGGMGAILRTILRREGLLGLYRGLLTSLLKTVPSSALTFVLVGQARRFFADPRRTATATVPSA